jgi:hypothetical protein
LLAWVLSSGPVGRSSDPTGDKTDNVLVHSEQEVGGCHVKHNSVPAVAVLHGFLGGRYGSRRAQHD